MRSDVRQASNQLPSHYSFQDVNRQILIPQHKTSAFKFSLPSQIYHQIFSFLANLVTVSLLFVTRINWLATNLITLAIALIFPTYQEKKKNPSQKKKKKKKKGKREDMLAYNHQSRPHQNGWLQMCTLSFFTRKSHTTGQAKFKECSCQLNHLTRQHLIKESGCVKTCFHEQVKGLTPFSAVHQKIAYNLLAKTLYKTSRIQITECIAQKKVC